MEQVRENPTVNKTLTLTTYAITSTAASGVINSTGIEALERGTSILLHLNGGTAQGFTEGTEYFIIPVGTNSAKLASSFENSLIGINITTTGDAGAGTVYPNYMIGGVLFVGTGGNVNIRGDGVSDTGSSSFSLHKNIADGSLIPLMIDCVSASGTTATDLVSWIH